MKHDHPPNEAGRGGGNDAIERLLKFAGSRPQPDAARTAEFKKHLHAEWRRVTEQNRRRRTFAWSAAIVAAAAAAIVVAWLPFSRTSPQPLAAVVLGRIVRTEGVVRSLPTSAAFTPGQSVAVGDDVRADTRIDTTAGGRVAIVLEGGVSLRVDADSHVVMIGERTVELERGAVYIDSGVEKRLPVLVQTQNGEIRDIGTQFEVRSESSALRVRVREGEVVVDRHGSTITARAGEALRLDPQGGYERSAVPIFGPEWDWTAAIAPEFQLEGSTVQQFLDWVSREQGWRWRFVDADTAQRAAGIVTHGSIEGYTPEEALAIVLPTCGLSFVRDRDEIVVSFEKELSPRGR